MPAFTLVSSTAAKGMFLLNVHDEDSSGDPDLADDETFLVSREELQDLEALIHKALYPVVLPPVEKFEVG